MGWFVWFGFGQCDTGLGSLEGVGVCGQVSKIPGGRGGQGEGTGHRGICLACVQGKATCDWRLASGDVRDTAA